MAVSAPLRLLFRLLRHRNELVKLKRRPFSTTTVQYTEDGRVGSDIPPRISRTRRHLSPLERISSLLPPEVLSPEVEQLREEIQPQGGQKQEIQPQIHPEEGQKQEIQPQIHPQEGQKQEIQPQESQKQEIKVSSTEEEDGNEVVEATGNSRVRCTLPGESLLVFGELLVAEHRKKRQEFKKMFQLQAGVRLQSNSGIIKHDVMAGEPAGRFFKTNLGVPIFIRRASLEDYVLHMKRGPAIAYPKDAGMMMMMMDVTEGDCVLESGSGSGGMSLFLSRAVGSRGSVLSVEVREDHHKRAVKNYQRWRTSWSLRRGQEWPDNVQFHHGNLSTASSLLTGRGFHAVALDIIHPQLVLSTVTPHLHSGAVCAVYLANISQVVELLEGLRCLALPLLCEHIVEVPIREWLVAPALQKDGQYCTRQTPIPDEELACEDETSDQTDGGGSTKEKNSDPPSFGSVPYIARPHPEQMSHTAFLVKLRKCVR